MYTVGSWFIHLMNVAIVAIVGCVVLGIIFWKKNQYARQSQGRLMAEVKQPGGWPKYYVVRYSEDAKWVRLGRGDYMLPKGVRDNPENPEDMSDVDRCKQRGEYLLKPSIKEWDWYPRRPFLGLRWLQVPIRKQSWYLDDPTPIVWPEYRVEVTAIDVQARTREMEAMLEGLETQEQEARQRQLTNALENQPNKLYVYLMVGVNIVLTVVILIQIFGMPGD